jgi:hypothetical protein
MSPSILQQMHGVLAVAPLGRAAWFLCERSQPSIDNAKVPTENTCNLQGVRGLQIAIVMTEEQLVVEGPAPDVTEEQTRWVCPRCDKSAAGHYCQNCREKRPDKVDLFVSCSPNPASSLPRTYGDAANLTSIRSPCSSS